MRALKLLLLLLCIDFSYTRAATANTVTSYYCEDIVADGQNLDYATFYMIGSIAGWNEVASIMSPRRVITEPNYDDLREFIWQTCSFNKSLTLLELTAYLETQHVTALPSEIENQYKTNLKKCVSRPDMVFDGKVMIDIEVDNDGLLQKLWPLREAAMSDRDRFKETYIALRNGILDCGSAGIPAEFFGKKPIRLEFTPAFFIE